jgi:hypothetical protein
MKSRWLDAGRAVLAGDLRGAAEILADIDAPAFEAFFRLKSGTEQDVLSALKFYRRVRATRYVARARRCWPRRHERCQRLRRGWAFARDSRLEAGDRMCLSTR